LNYAFFIFTGVQILRTLKSNGCCGVHVGTGGSFATTEAEG